MYKYALQLFYIILVSFTVQLNLLGSEYKSIKKVTKKAYLRAGPGKWYPVKWTLKIPRLPLKILEENGNYYFVEIYDSTKGWISKNLLSDKQQVVIINDTFIYNKEGKPKALIKKNVILDLIDCRNIKLIKHCEVKNNKTSGFVKKENLWGNVSK